MLSFSEFNRLDHDDKGDFTFDTEHCTYLISYAEDETYSLSLYRRAAPHATNAPGGAFFIEVWYNVNDNTIDSYRSFKTHKLLKPYLEVIDIADLWR